MNEKVRSRVKAAKMGFLRRISGLTLLDKIKSANIRESLNSESLLSPIKKTATSLVWTCDTNVPGKNSYPVGRRPRDRFRNRWRDYVEDLNWSRFWHSTRAF